MPTPKADPDPPAGILTIDNGASMAPSKEVVLYMTATDEPLPGMAQGANAHLTDQLSDKVNEVSGNVEMRVGNDEDLSGEVWELFAEQKDWTLACEDGEVCTVYAQFRDGAENESLVTADSILLDVEESIFLPIVTR